MKYVIALAIALIATPAAAEEEACFDQSTVINYVIHNAIGGRVVDSLSGEQAQKFIQAYNAFPPATDLVADDVLVFGRDPMPTGEDGMTMLVVFFADGCRLGAMHMFDPKTLKDIYTAAFGGAGQDPGI